MGNTYDKVFSGAEIAEAAERAASPRETLGPAVAPSRAKQAAAEVKNEPAMECGVIFISPETKHAQVQ